MLRNRPICIFLAVSLAAVILWVAATAARLEVLPPTGPHAVGRTRLAWVDSSRPERFHPERNREVIAEVWYPARPGTGQPATYFPELARIKDEAIRAGALSSLEAWGLGQIQSRARLDADLAQITGQIPVVFFSPGNSTNVELYAAYGEELASHGFVVFGINHPHDVMAVRLMDDTVVGYVSTEPGEAGSVRVDERAADLRFVLDRLAEMARDGNALAAKLDLNRVAVMGHSRGGHTAARACASDQRLRCGINIDGLHAGNPYSTRAGEEPPAQPFLYIGKERTISAQTRELIAANPDGSLISVPDAAHADFSDGGAFEPTLNPFNGNSRRALDAARREARAFLEQHLGSP
jgi:pimeloyl-ACP methyl ester carboxylesterase